jgi:DNA-directed RNA polymerase beta' subunit
VIIPDPTLKADEIHLSYLAFLELYRYEIIAHLSKVSNITHNQAADEWHRAAITFDPKIYEIMMYMVKKRKPKVIMNRNPTINYGSLLLMKITHVKRSYKDDFTMSIPIQVLSALNADQRLRSGLSVMIKHELCERLTSGVDLRVC